MTTATTPLAITGSTGNLGGRVARRLADTGISQDCSSATRHAHPSYRRQTPSSVPIATAQQSAMPSPASTQH
jgi:uncharacterized protein YbjT (DUF2867 family)